MSERKNHLDIEGAQAKEDEHIATYKPIPEADTEFRPSKPSLTKSREKVTDEAAEQLLTKEDEARIATRVDMADAKYVVGDHRNGDAKIELDASKRQFSGLTKEELLKYADDPFWVRLRWFMFALFWALWLCMLAGAVAIIVTAPKCAPPPPKTKFQKGPLVDLSTATSLQELDDSLAQLQKSQVQAIFIPGSLAGDTYKVLEEENALDQIKGFIKKAKDYGVSVVVDLTANFVPSTHHWFTMSENRTAPYADYFIWAKGGDHDEAGVPKPPNNWVSTANTPAWSYSEKRKEFYLNQYGAGLPDLNFREPEVVGQFDKVLRSWMAAGAAGVRLVRARELIVNSSLPDETPDTGAPSLGSDHTQYTYWRHRHTSDQADLTQLMMHWAHIVATAGEAQGDTVFTIAESPSRVELMLLSHNATSLLRPPSAAPRDVNGNVTATADYLATRLPHWPLLQLKSEAGEELAAFALLLPAAPVLSLHQLPPNDNDTSATEFLKLVSLRSDASVEHGRRLLAAAPANNATGHVLVITRWKAGHTGYMGVWNPSPESAVADVTSLAPVPPELSLHYASKHTHQYTNFTNNQALKSDYLLVPPRSTLVLSFVPKTVAEQ